MSYLLILIKQIENHEDAEMTLAERTITMELNDFEAKEIKSIVEVTKKLRIK